MLSSSTNRKLATEMLMFVKCKMYINILLYVNKGVILSIIFILRFEKKRVISFSHSFCMKLWFYICAVELLIIHLKMLPKRQLKTVFLFHFHLFHIFLFSLQKNSYLSFSIKIIFLKNYFYFSRTTVKLMMVISEN